ncbi:adenylyltransferase/cytidyltransferase family protein [Candidatus Methylospira mobilis]|uniref:Adenylyltransferase/cytidyltransferase family protein n=1 Tax=Candidatus Methylospira mobilis TaxID=1808979 RepID=A0A5Q0BLM2_9GAMM|nr:adenylyltransferase/cytidyltransferase family protein [Candidatus Methylospira mobilis]
MTPHLAEDVASLLCRLDERRTGAIIGYTSGVFDLFHQGHLNYLNACKLAVDVLVVGVDADILVRIRKGSHRAYEKCNTRVAHVQETGLVDELFIKTNSSDEIIPIIRPHRYFIPSNRQISALRSQLLNDLSVRLDVLPYTSGVSTTKMARLIGISSDSSDFENK